MLTFVIWMVRPHQSALTGGIFVGAAVFATALGVVLLPFSMIGILAGLLLALGIPLIVQQTSSLVFEQSLMEIASDNALVSTRGVERLRRWSVLIDLERIVDEYVKETEPNRRA